MHVQNRPSACALGCLCMGRPGFISMQLVVPCQYGPNASPSCLPAGASPSTWPRPRPAQWSSPPQAASPPACPSPYGGQGRRKQMQRLQRHRGSAPLPACRPHCWPSRDVCVTGGSCPPWSPPVPCPTPGSSQSPPGGSPLLSLPLPPPLLQQLLLSLPLQLQRLSSAAACVCCCWGGAVGPV